MTRAFTQRQKKIMEILAGNKCENCGKNLKGKFHADHKMPYSKKGKTILQNSQALCSECNLKKGNKI